VGIFLRFYHFQEFVTFLGDQARDAIIIKRILLFEHFPAIGAPMSVGGVYLGPFYYYFIAPWLLLFMFNPIGLAFGVGVFSCLYILIQAIIMKDLFNQKAAIIASVLVTFSYLLIDFSRFSWNPNLLPLFVLITSYFFIKALVEKSSKYFFLAGIFLGCSIQLHYLALLLGIPMIIILCTHLVRNRGGFKYVFKGLMLMGISFLVVSSPLLIFDLRHQFLNTHNFIKLFSQQGNQTSNILQSLYTFPQEFYRLFLHVSVPSYAALIVFLISIFTPFFFLKKNTGKNEALIYTMLFMVSITLGLALYGGQKLPHYLATLIPLYIVSLGYTISLLWRNYIGVSAIAIILVLYVFLNSLQYTFFYLKGNDQISMARTIARTIFNNVHEEKYSVTSLPLNFASLPPRYFLEIWGKRPVDQDSTQRSDELFVTCETECRPIGDPQWDIAFFAATRVVKKWHVENVTIYQLKR
jgi:4-amino-4-deoxy-L-arabinose transferase-like glycosyltransferase